MNIRIPILFNGSWSLLLLFESQIFPVLTFGNPSKLAPMYFSIYSHYSYALPYFMVEKKFQSPLVHFLPIPGTSSWYFGSFLVDQCLEIRGTMLLIVIGVKLLPVRFFYLCHTNKCIITSHCFNFNFSNDTVENLFICILAMHASSLNCIQTFCPCSKNYVIFLSFMSSLHIVVMNPLTDDL